MMRFHWESEVPAPRERVWAWHERCPAAFRRLLVPWRDVAVLDVPDRLREGAPVELKLRLGPLSRRWAGRIVEVEAPQRFVDVADTSPFASWRHEHSFLPGAVEGTCRMRDTVTCALPGGPLGRLGEPLLRSDLERLFRYRHRVVAQDFERYGDQLGRGEPRRERVLISGASGLVGTALKPLLELLGYEVWVLTRSPKGARELGWNLYRGEVDTRVAQLGFAGVIHLAGANIAGGRWSPERKRAILESREQGTRLLAKTLAAAPEPPRVCVCASGTNAYKADGQPHDEGGAWGEGFLAEVCRRWEDAAEPLERAGVRTVFVRTGVVLTPSGGALQKLLPPFRAGLGGRIGSGRQHMGWIGLDDLADVYVRALQDQGLSGPVNAVAPERVTNAAFAQTLGRVLRRPAVLPLPAAVVRTAFGQMGEETLLADVQPVPGVLERAAFPFRTPTLEGALRHALGRTEP